MVVRLKAERREHRHAVNKVSAFLFEQSMKEQRKEAQIREHKNASVSRELHDDDDDDDDDGDDDDDDDDDDATTKQLPHGSATVDGISKSGGQRTRTPASVAPISTTCSSRRFSVVVA